MIKRTLENMEIKRRYNMTELIIRTGMLSGSLSEQLENQNLTLGAKELEKYEKIMFSIRMLTAHGYITDAVQKKSWNKLVDDLGKIVETKEI